MTLPTDQALAALSSSALRFGDGIRAACARYAISTPLRLSHFLAQIAHESGGFRYVREIWGPTPAQERYEGRADLGNVEPGDGHRFMGRGLIQITGRTNYQRVSRALLGGDDLLVQPARLEEPRLAVLSAAWFWDDRELNALADRNDIERITRRINGGLNGLDDRRAWFDRAATLFLTSDTTQ